MQEHLIAFGGHKGAAGVTIAPEKLQMFRELINASALVKELEVIHRNEDILGQINVSVIDNELLSIFDEFEPYGQKNPRPFFEVKDAKVINIRSIGLENKHLKILFKQGYKMFEAMFFNYDYLPRVGEVLNLEISISKNFFGGVLRPQIVIHKLEKGEENAK